MNNDQETVIAGFLTYLQTALSTTFPTIGRRVQFWSDVSEQPALFIRHNAAEDEWQQQLSRVTVELEAWIYTKTISPDDVPDTNLNAAVLAFRNALAPDNVMTHTFTIGGLAYWCRVEGRSEYYPGDIAGQAVAIVPVKIILP